MRKPRKRAAPYRIEFTNEADQHLKKNFDAGERSLVLSGVDLQLSQEPARDTKQRKKMRPNWLANYRLRIAGNLRVYYDVDEKARVVTIRAVGKKRVNKVLLGDKEIDLG